MRLLAGLAAADPPAGRLLRARLGAVFSRPRQAFLRRGSELRAFKERMPEPSTWAMMALGFAALGWLARLRRRNLTPA